MNSRITRTSIHRFIYLFTLSLLVCCLPLSPYILSISQFLLVINWLAEGNWHEKIFRQVVPLRTTSDRTLNG